MGYLEEIESPKYELVCGEEVLMAPAGTGHNCVGGNLYAMIHTYLRGKKCRVFYETMVVLDEKNRLIPDLMVVCDRSKIQREAVYGAPDLVVEILSPSTRKRDLGVKKDAYERFGVKEYWIVNPKDKSIEAYHLADGRLRFDNVYSVLEEWEWKALSEKEQAGMGLKLKVSLYEDLVIDVRDVFEGVE